MPIKSAFFALYAGLVTTKNIMMAVITSLIFISSMLLLDASIGVLFLRVDFLPHTGLPC